MKNVFVLFLIFLGVVTGRLSAQIDSIPPKKSPANPNPMYVGWGGTVPRGLVFTVGGFSRHGWGGSLSVNWMSRFAKNLPHDYDGGKGLLGEGSDKIKDDDMKIFSFRVSKVFALNSKNASFGIEVGPSIVKSTIADNFIRVPNPCTQDPFFGATFCKKNYEYQRLESSSLGLSLRGKLGLSMFNHAGIELGLQSNLNPKWPYVGIDFLLVLGHVRYR